MAAREVGDRPLSLAREVLEALAGPGASSPAAEEATAGRAAG
jgi:hypothetical protein